MTGLDYPELIAAATIGCNTRHIRLSDLDSTIAATMPPVADGADLVLDAAAVYAMHRRAVTSSAASPPERIQIPAGHRPAVSSAFAALVRRLLTGSNEDRDLVVDALAGLYAARGNKVALPPDLVAEVWSSAAKPGRANLARALLPLLDEKDLAVIGQVDPTWAVRLTRAQEQFSQSSATSDDEPKPGVSPNWDDWETGTKSARQEFFAGLRRTDPNRAAALLAEPSFKKEKAADRAALIELLAVGLSSADEPLLMDLLSDRAAGPRRAAHGLLRQLPESQLVAAAEAAVLANLEIERSKPGVLRRLSGGKPELTLHLNSIPPTNELTALGFEAETGRKLLAELLSAVPTKRWPELVEAGAAELAVAKTTIDGVAEDLTAEWAVAATNWRDVELATVLLDEKSVLVNNAAEFLPSGVLETRLEKVVRSAKPTEITSMVGATTAELSVPVIEELLAKVRSNQDTKDPTASRMNATLLAAIGSQTPISATRQLADRVLKLEPENYILARQVREVAGQLQLRAAIAEAIDSCPNPGDSQ